MTRVKIKGDKEFLAALKSAAHEVLEACVPVLTAAARRAISSSPVPVRTGDLKQSSFVDPPRKHETAAVVVCGFDHPFAAHIHEGWTYGIKGPAPRFLTKGANAARLAFRAGVVERVNAVLKSKFR
jgi:hypothetical protein